MKRYLWYFKLKKKITIHEQHKGKVWLSVTLKQQWNCYWANISQGVTSLLYWATHAKESLAENNISYSHTVVSAEEAPAIVTKVWRVACVFGTRGVTRRTEHSRPPTQGTPALGGKRRAPAQRWNSCGPLRGKAQIVLSSTCSAGFAERESPVVLRGVGEGSGFTQTSQDQQSPSFRGILQVLFVCTLCAYHYSTTALILSFRVDLFAVPRLLFCPVYSRNHQCHLFMATALSNKDFKVIIFYV